MVGATLRDISRHVDCLAAPGGPYAVVCGRTGCEPHPVSGLRFDDRDTAAEAAKATAEYRATLRQYDPRVPFYEPLVHDVEDAPTDVASAAEADARLRYLSFCHDVAGATFEALSDAGFREIESAAMETYLTLAEVVDDRDDFCLTLLWSVTSELAYRATNRQQVAIVDAVARSLRAQNGQTAVRPDEGIRATMAELERAGFVESASISPGIDDGTWVLTLGDYALAERTGRLPTLPLSVALARRLPDTAFRFAAATPLGDRRWRVSVETGEDPGGLVSVDAADDERLYDTSFEY